MLRTTILYLRKGTKIVLSGELIGEGAKCLARAITQCSSTPNTVVIDLDGITCVDRAGEEALLSLWQTRRRFLCTSPFARTLCQRLAIPIEGDSR